MKKVGIVTFSNSTNYGGVLQAAALCKVLEKLDMQPVNITVQKMASVWKSPLNYIKMRIRIYGSKGYVTKLRIFGGALKTVFSNIHIFSVKRKQDSFKNFINRNLNSTPYYATTEILKEKCGNFYAYITGSDQVWNNAFTYNQFQGKFFLDFAPDGASCYSYAASVGGKKTDEYVKEVIYRTQHFKGITVREKSLEDHMRKLGCEQVHTVLDPTLLLSKEEWTMLEQRPQCNIPKHYILVYYLEKDTLHDPTIKKVSEQLDLPVIDIMPKYGKAEYNRIIDDTAGPAEFLYYVNHADYVITNSFHMVVFSLLYRKKFIALRRDGQESRIEDLLNKVGMGERYISNLEEWSVIKKEVKDISEIIENEKIESITFLKKIGDDDADT